MNTRISIIVPAYQAECTLEACLESISRQTYKAWELILVDDGSTDSTPALCDDWAARDSRIRVIHRNNGGLSASRNSGLEKATGEYVTFVDADDSITPNLLEQLMAELESHPEYDILEYAIEKVWPEGRRERWQPDAAEYRDWTDYWLKGEAYTHTYACNKVFRRTLFNSEQFPEGILFEDAHILPRLARRAHCIATTPTGTYEYNQHQGSIIHQATGDTHLMLLKNNIPTWQTLVDNKTVTSQRRHELSRYYIELLNIQITCFRQTHQSPILPAYNVSIGACRSIQEFVKVILLKTIGIEKLCRIMAVKRKVETDSKSLQKTLTEQYNRLSISFILTYHDEPEAYVKEAVNSIMNLPLTNEEREVILIDDGSRRPLDEFINTTGTDIIIHRQQNQGLSVARNTGLAMARGEYIQFVDADDMLLTNAYSKCIDILRTQHPDILQFCYTHKPNDDMPSSSCSRIAASVNATCSGAHFVANNNLRPAAWGYVFRKQIADKLQFIPGIIHEDEAFTPRLFLNAKTLIHTTIPAYFYRERQSSITHRTDSVWKEKRMGDLLYIIIDMKQAAGEQTGEKQQALRRRTHQLAMAFVYQALCLFHKRKEAEKHINKLREHDLFPLPCHAYSTRYLLFCLASATAGGRAMLSRLIRNHKGQ